LAWGIAGGGGETKYFRCKERRRQTIRLGGMNQEEGWGQARKWAMKSRGGPVQKKVRIVKKGGGEKLEKGNHQLESRNCGVEEWGQNKLNKKRKSNLVKGKRGDRQKKLVGKPFQ